MLNVGSYIRSHAYVCVPLSKELQTLLEKDSNDVKATVTTINTVATDYQS